jgi:PAS domain S-box-containing protein
MARARRIPPQGAAHAVEVEAARWQAILQTARDGLVSIDATGRITVFNPTAAEMFGYSSEEVLGQNVSILMDSPHREDHDRYLSDYHRTRVPKAIGRIRYVEARRRDGTRFPIELSVSEARVGSEIIYTAIIRDVTERHRVEREIATRVLQQAAVVELGRKALAGARMSVLMDDAVETVARTLGVEYCKILECLPAGFRLRAGVGWRDGLVGRAIVAADQSTQAGFTLSNAAPVIVDDLRTETRFSASPLLREHGAVSGMSVVVPGRDHPFGILAAHSRERRTFTAEDTNFLQAVANVLATAIERHRAQEEAREFEKRMEQRNRLADMGAVAAQVVHDLGNPLAALSLQAEILLRRASREPSAGEALQGPIARIVKEVHRLDQLIHDFKDVARQQRLSLAPVDLRTFLATVVEIWRPVAEAHAITLELDVPPGLPRLRADEAKLHRVLDNLIRNAVEAIATGPGGIRISAAAPAPDRLRVSVRDSGPGIAPEVHVFRLFETTKPGGLGLGLAIAKQIALAHGGDLELERLGVGGTAFHLDLPVADDLTRP